MTLSSSVVAAFGRVVAILTLLGVVAAPLAPGQVSFYQTPTYTGTAAVIGDFNLDGKLDIINSAGTVLLGKGDGTFTTGTTLSNAPSFVADFNGDGKPDVLAFTASYHLLVYLGNGDGTFQPPQDTYAAVPLYGMAVADLVTGVNEADVLVPNPTGGVLVYLGKGDGTFAAPVNYPSPTLGQLFVGDFNGDGKPDVLGTSYGLVAVLLGNGDGTFQAAKTTSASALAFVQAIGDLNGDQKLDLFISTSSNPAQLATMFGNGDGTFQAPSHQFTPDLSDNPTLADLNGDGKLDLLVQGSPPFLQVYLGNGDGTFALGQTYSYNSINLFSSNIFVGDFNGDQKLDVTATQSILFGNGDGTFQASPAIVPPNGDFAAVSGDFNGDGKSDMAVTSSDGNLYIYLAGTGGSFSLAHTYAISANNGGLQTGDFNGDGKVDLIASVNSGGIAVLAVLLGNGDGSFGTPVESTSCPAAGVGIGAIADLNGDHKSDLAFPNGESLSICLGNGDGTFASAVNYFFGSNPSSVVVADFNNDGKLDAVVGGDAGVALFLGNGDGTFQGANYLFTTNSFVELAADFNRDGNEDLIINYTVYLGNGKGGFQALTQPTTGLGGAVVDLNGDGYLDLYNDDYFVNDAPETVVLIGNGDGTFQAPIVLETGAKYGTYPGVGLTADFNGDGRPDLAASWGAVGSPVGIQILLNTTPPAPGVSVAPTTVAFPSQVAGTSSSPVGVTVSNTGKGVLTVSGVKVTGTSASEFSQTNNCVSIQAGANCTIKVVFAPTAGGNASASLVITDNAVGSPQSIGLSGTATAAPDFAIGPAAGSSNSATVTSGQAASFNLTVSPAGSFSGTVSLSCAITPAVTPAPICTLPASVNVTQGAAAPVAVKVSTTASGTSAGSISSANFPAGVMPASWMMLLLASGLLFAGYRRRIRILGIPLIAVAFLAMPGCGGGGGSSSSTTTPGTPAGTYTATVTAKSGSLSHTTALTVIVQ
jgi:hypothetical protein